MFFIMAENQEEVMWPRLVTKKILGERLRSNNNFVADFPSNAEASSLLDINSSLGPPSLSENNILNQRKHNFQNYKVFISTWNVGGIAPQDDLDIADWLDTPNNMCDIYVFGFQEMVPLRASYVLGSENSKISMKWNSLIREALNKKIQHCLEKQQYNNKLGRKQKTAKDEQVIFESSIPEGFRCVISKQMVGILISVWIRSDLCPYVRHPKASCVGCGIMGYLGNKGSVSVRFHLHETSFCFVCSHLASGGREGDEKHRKSDVAEIFSRTSFPRGPSFDLPRKILDHDRVILLGDLNYRISLPEATTRLLVDRKEWNALLENDQLMKLRMELMSGQVFEGWREGLIKFAPTYKYCLNSNVYFGCVEGQKGGKWRAPAWCDRIIWHGEGLQQRLYTRGLGCDTAVVVNVLGNRNASQRDSIQQEYESLFSDDLKKQLALELHGHLKKAVSLWMKSPVERDVTTWRQALTGPIIDIKAATEIICTRISSQIRQIKQVYTPTFGTFLEYDIGYHTSGDHRKFLLAYIDTTRYDGPEIERVLVEEDAIAISKIEVKKSGMDESEFIQIFTERSSAHLSALASAYHKMFRKELRKTIKRETSGNFKHALLTNLEYAVDPTKHYATASCIGVALLFCTSLVIPSFAELERLEHAAKADGSLSFLVVGDWGRRGFYNQSHVAFQMGKIGEKLDIDFVVSTGDNFYDNGLTGLNDQAFEESFTKIYTATSLQKQWYSVLGNHDYRGDVEAQVHPALRKVDSRWLCLRSFILNAEIAGFFFVDTTPFVSDYFTDMDHTYDWRGVTPRKAYLDSLLKDLESALSESTARWKIVVGHHAIKSAGYHGDTKELIDLLLPMLKAYNVDMYVNGHDHCLEHISSLDSPIQYLTSGAGSKAWRGDLNQHYKEDDLRFFYDGQGFMSVQLTKNDAEITFYNAFGKILHEWKALKELHSAV
ncbi:hypothetical protein NC653_025105 [Populus alba x Populus x berolinensis]|uniref:acid phosphatase n=1 Tax=Populus alba x Populus x berolinensis TaxID=444605 RepID=A0AAD6Q7L1_9ROSI|nr:hypothetical protein NC653_025105 [Populus alba x Populus x berolinensis]